MRLRALQIENFGIHRNRRLELASGVQLLFGPNEAGKSTLLAVLRQLLFGFPHQTPYLKCSDDKIPLAAAAEFELQDGRRGRLRRQKGRPDAVTGELTGETGEFDQAGLQRLLGGATSAVYENMFAFSTDELKAGADSLKAASLEDALFGGGLGGLARYRRIEDELSRRMLDRFNPNTRARNQTINQLLAKLKSAREEFQRNQCRPQSYDDLQQAFGQQAKQVNRLTEELEGHRRARLECLQWLQALPLFAQWVAAREERQGIPVSAAINSDVVARFRQLTAARSPLVSSLAELDRELRLRPAIPPLSVAAERCVQAAADIGRLQRELSRMSLLQQELPGLRKELGRLETDLDAVRAEWSGEGPPEVSLAQRVGLRSLVEERAPLLKRETQLRTRREDLDQRLMRPRKKFEKLPAAESVEEWDQLADRCRLWRDDSVALALLKDELAAAQREEQTQWDELRGAVPFDADFPPGGLPLRSTLEEYRSRWQTANDDLQRRHERQSETRDDLAAAQSALADWDRTGKGDSRAKVVALRQHRDAGWGLIRRRFEGAVESLTGEIETWTDGRGERLLDLFESSVAAADLQADRLLVDAEWQARRDQLAERIGRLEERLSDQLEALQQQEQSFAALETDWRKEWVTSGLTPRRPAEMLEWMDGYEEWQQARRLRGDLVERFNRLQARCTAAEDQLRARLTALPAAPEAAAKHVETRRDVVHQQESNRSRLMDEIDELQADIEVLKEQECEAGREVGDWRNRLRRLLAELCLPEDWSLESLQRVLENIDSGRQTQMECARLREQIGSAETALEDFGRRVREVLDSLDVEPSDDPVAEAERLAVELEEAQQLQRQRAKAEEESSRDRALQTHHSEQLAELDQELAQLYERTGELDAVALQLAVEQFETATELDALARNLERDLRHQLGSGWMAAQELLSKATDTALRERLLQIDQSIADVEQLRQTAIEQRWTAESRLQSLADETAGLALGAELQSLRASLEQEAHQWAPLALTRAVMQRARERFEREHQPRILQEVGRLLGRITDGEHAGIERTTDGTNTLLVKGRDGETLLRPDQLSTGAQAQLYLAIRLAFATDYCAQNEPLPVVMDDVLVTFDEQRARQTLEVLSEFAANTQVLLLTCHRRTVQLWREVQPESPIIELGQPTTDDEQKAARRKTRRPRKTRPSDADDSLLFPPAS
ncbi:MAG: AAA family ATPase [Planctomycetaceae bacterium]